MSALPVIVEDQLESAIRPFETAFKTDKVTTSVGLDAGLVAIVRVYGYDVAEFYTHGIRVVEIMFDGDTTSDRANELFDAVCNWVEAELGMEDVSVVSDDEEKTHMNPDIGTMRVTDTGSDKEVSILVPTTELFDSYATEYEVVFDSGMSTELLIPNSVSDADELGVDAELDGEEDVVKVLRWFWWDSLDDAEKTRLLRGSDNPNEVPGMVSLSELD